MDKLKPLIVHRFWILFFITLILPPIAWMQTTGALSKDTDERTTALDGVLKAIPTGVDAPNDDWSAQAKILADIRQQKNQLALKQLWNEQVKTRVWSPNVTPFLKPDREKAKVCPYRGELPDQNEREQVPDIYKNEYNNEVRRVWKIVYPREDRSDPKRAKIVDFPLLAMPRVPARTWQSLPPTWPEIWNSMEDLWLLEQLLSAVQRTNSFSTNLLDANVKRIDAIELFAGKRVGPTEVGTAAAGASGGSMMGGGGADSGIGMGMGAGGGQGAGATGIKPVSADFPLSEEYTVAATAGGGMGMMGGGSSGDAAGGAAGAATAAARYIQDTPAFRTRGFRIRVIVRQQNAPEFMREILNSRYPIEISRMQLVSVNAPFGASGTGGGGGMMGGVMAGGGFNESVAPGFDGGLVGDTGATVGGFDPTNPAAGIEGGLAPGAGSGVPGATGTDASIYNDPNLVSLVIVGEMFLYNEPKLPEAPAADPAAETPAVPGDAAPVTPGSEVPVAEGTPAAKTPADAAVPAVVDPAAEPGEPAVAEPAAAKPAAPAKPAVSPAAPAAGNN